MRTSNTYDHLRGRKTMFCGVSINIRPPSGSNNLLSHLVSIGQIAKRLLGQILNTLNNDIAQSAKTFNQALAMQPPGNSKINYSFALTL